LKNKKKNIRKQVIDFIFNYRIMEEKEEELIDFVKQSMLSLIVKSNNKKK
jgi:hypothetical protein